MVESDDKRMVACSENFLLREGSLNFVPLDHFLFGEHCFLSAYLHGVFYPLSLTFHGV
jgi:hypothetical protein